MSEPEGAEPAPTAAPAPAPSGRLSVADMVAELDAEDAKAPAAEEPKEAETDADEATADETPADTAVDEDDEAEAEDEPSDPDLDKRLGAIQKAEKRSREQVDQWRAEVTRDFEAREAKLVGEWKSKVDKADRVTELFERAKFDPGPLAAEYGWDRETKLFIAQSLYAEAKAEEGDPKYREQAARARRDREAAGKTTELEKRLAEVTERLERQDLERRVDAIASRAEAAVGDKTPLLRHILAKNPDHARERIRQATAFIRKETGREPDPAAVVAQLEEVERLELSARGIDPLAAIGAARAVAKPPQPNPKNKTQDAGEKTTAMQPIDKVTTKPPAQNGRVSRAQIARELEELEAKEAAG